MERNNVTVVKSYRVVNVNGRDWGGKKKKKKDKGPNKPKQSKSNRSLDVHAGGSSILDLDARVVF